MHQYKQFLLDKLLLKSNSAINIIPVCDHYAGTERSIQKSLLFQNKFGSALDLTLDFEDGSAMGDEEYQRTLINDTLNNQHNIHGRVGVRIHSVETLHWQLDVDAVITKKGNLPAFINIPKVQRIEEIKKVDFYIKQRLSTHGRKSNIPIHIMLEDAPAISRAHDLVNCGMVECCSFGLLDFVSSFGGAIPASAMHSPAQFEHPLVREAKIKLAFACHAAGVIPSHSITVDIGDPEQAYQDARRAREEFGYLRMWSIHPSQIEPIISAFQYSQEELEEAIVILEQALKINLAPILFKGKMHDRASYRFFWIKIRRALLNEDAFSKELERLLEKLLILN